MDGGGVQDVCAIMEGERWEQKQKQEHTLDRRCTSQSLRVLFSGPRLVRDEALGALYAGGGVLKCGKMACRLQQQDGKER